MFLLSIEETVEVPSENEEVEPSENRRLTRTKAKTEEVKSPVVEKPVEVSSENRRLTRTKAKTEEEAPSENRRLTRTKAKNEEIKSPVAEKPIAVPSENRRLTRTKAKNDEVKSPVVEKPVEVPLENRRLTRTKAKNEEVKASEIEDQPVEAKKAKLEEEVPTENRRLTRTKAKNEEVKTPESEDKPIEAEPENRRRTRTKAKVIIFWKNIFRDHPKTTLTKICPILTTYLPIVDVRSLTFGLLILLSMFIKQRKFLGFLKHCKFQYSSSKFVREKLEKIDCSLLVVSFLQNVIVDIKKSTYLHTVDIR